MLADPPIKVVGLANVAFATCVAVEDVHVVHRKCSLKFVNWSQKSSPFETPDAERDRINALSNISVRFSSDTKQDGLFSRQENGLSGSEMRFRR